MRIQTSSAASCTGNRSLICTENRSLVCTDTRPVVCTDNRSVLCKDNRSAVYTETRSGVCRPAQNLPNPGCPEPAQPPRTSPEPATPLPEPAQNLPNPGCPEPAQPRKSGYPKKAHTGAVLVVYGRQKSLCYTGGKDGTIKVWQFQEGKL